MCVHRYMCVQSWICTVFIPIFQSLNAINNNDVHCTFFLVGNPTKMIELVYNKCRKKIHHSISIHNMNIIYNLKPMLLFICFKCKSTHCHQCGQCVCVSVLFSLINLHNCLNLSRIFSSSFFVSNFLAFFSLSLSVSISTSRNI